jgi:RluA family pseudouridine synthase
MKESFDRWIVSYKEDGMRLVNFIKLKTGSEISLRVIKSVLEKGVSKVNNVIETFASKKLRKGDIVQVEKCWDRGHSSENEQADKSPKKLYEDDYFIAIDKKAGFLCEDTEVKKYFPDCILVHRLDKQTSGVLLLAKSEAAKSKMKALFKDKKIYKTYIAIVDGKFTERHQKIENFLVKRTDTEGKVLWRESRTKGVYAISVFELLKARKLYSVVKCFPITGRTHQLRVHLLGLGHPILGDYQYFRDFKYTKFMNRLMLHSYQIEFTHPFLEKKIRVISQLPKEFKNFISKV